MRGLFIDFIVIMISGAWILAWLGIFLQGPFFAICFVNSLGF